MQDEDVYQHDWMGVSKCVYSSVAVESEHVGGIDKCRMGLRNCVLKVSGLCAELIHAVTHALK